MLDISSAGETLKVHGAIDNTLETYWEIGEQKIPLERVKKWHSLVCVGSPHWLPRISIPTCVCHHFWPRLITGA
jgi:hypothetical protein